MVKENIKILGDKFKFYNPIASNMLSPQEKEWIITQQNVEELLDSFYNREGEVYVYAKHKSSPDEERVAIGTILDIRPDENGIGLIADIDFNDKGEDLVNNKSKKPSIEMIGDVFDNDEAEEVYLSNLKISGLALVEIPASNNVSLVASAIVESDTEKNNNKKDFKTMENLNSLLQDFQNTGALSVEALDLIKSDDEFLKYLVQEGLKVLATKSSVEASAEEEEEKKEEAVAEEEKKEDEKVEASAEETDEEKAVEEEEKKEEEKKEEELQLSLTTWEGKLKRFAQKQGKEIALSCVDATYPEAKDYFAKGMTLNKIINYFDKTNSFSYINGRKEVEMKLSVADNDSFFKDLGKSVR